MSRVDWHGDEVINEINKALIDFLTWAAYLVEAKAKWYATGNEGGPNVQTGTLRRSITIEVDKAQLIAYVGTNVHYAIYLELGTIKMYARPFLRPALWGSIPEIQQEFNRRFRGK